MQTIRDILKRAGGWHPGLSLTIDNAPFMPLVIEAMDESGPCGLPALSIAHYGEQNGDLMCDPEMCFELSFAGGVPDLNPFFYRNDSIGSEQWSRFITGTEYAYHCELHRQHVSFAKVWTATCDHRDSRKPSTSSANRPPKQTTADRTGADHRARSMTPHA